VSFEKIKEFENEIAKFFGAPFAVAVDCCTHGLELSLRFNQTKEIAVPNRTYLSVPMLADKLNIQIKWLDKEWQGYYYLTNNVIDAAVLWKRNSYIPGTMMSVSFQFKKHLSLGRGGMILLDDPIAREKLKEMSYDGRSPDLPWTEQNIKTIGYHYYMTPETAELGLAKLPAAISTPPKRWVYEDWADLTKMDVFKDNGGS
jgi:dTDP-4-amino-4,6-dideoxygalactose transaminase